MAGQIYFTDDELRVLHGLVRSTLLPKAVRLDPDSKPLQSVLEKLQKQANRAFCDDCGDPEVYAKGRCEPCYRRQHRAKAG